MATVKADQTNFSDTVLKADKPVVVDFWAEWCGPCKQIAPALEEISEANQNVTIVKVNVDENPDLAAQYGVRSIPTLIAFKNGARVDMKFGGMSKGALEGWVNSQA